MEPNAPAHPTSPATLNDAVGSIALQRIRSSASTLALYEELIALLDGLGDYLVEPKKTSIHMVKERAFLGVAPRKDALLLNIVADREIVLPRIRKAEQLSRHRWHCELLVASAGDFDEELHGLIRQGYEFAARPR